MNNISHDDRIGALRRFGLAVTALTIAGQALLGFEQSIAHPIVAAITAYAVEILMETLRAREAGQTPRYHGNFLHWVDFLLPAHISGLVIAMLTYPNENLWPLVFGATVAICSKYLFRVPDGKGGTVHFLNPSNTGIITLLVLFPWMSLAPPYMFTAHVGGPLKMIIPVAIVGLGTFINTRFTKRMPLVLGWIAGFITQAVVRWYFFDQTLSAVFYPLTGTILMLFTFYMITDPGTSPIKVIPQMVFGLSIGLVYGAMTIFHVVFGIFYAVLLVCAVRGATLYFVNRNKSAVASNSEMKWKMAS